MYKVAKMDRIYEDRELLVYKDGGKSAARHPIVQETPLTIMLNGEELATLVCSPHSLELLAIGFLVSEGILADRGDLKAVVSRPEQGVVWVETADGAVQLDGFRRRHLTAGRERGRASLYGLDDLQPLPHKTYFAVKDLLGWTKLLDQEAKTFRLTGGVHEAVLAHGEGLVISYEDIGRHNALDRVLGYTFLNDIDTCDKAVVLSSRISAEMLAKAARMGVPLVVSRAAPTCLSIDLAEQLGITLVGFARGNSLNVYTHPGRITK